MSTAATSATVTTVTATATAERHAHASSPGGAGGSGMGAPTGPWWRHPMMWLVVGGPSLVVVASFITLTLAVRHADPVVEHGSQAGGAHVSAEEAGSDDSVHARNAALGATATAAVTATAKPASVDDAALQPAMRARNHAATGGKDH